MALSDIKIRTLKPTDKAVAVSDGGGLYIEVLPSSKKRWGLKYRIGGKQETVRLGDYPDFGLAEARQWRAESKALVSRGLSPMALKRGDAVPTSTPLTAKELVESYNIKWFSASLAKQKIQLQSSQDRTLVRNCINGWFVDIVVSTNKNPRNIQRCISKDIVPKIGDKDIKDVTIQDIVDIIDSIKARGADQMALQTRNVLKRFYSYLIARGLVIFNPPAAMEAKYIAVARSRDVALTKAEIGKLLRSIYKSNMNRAYMYALHLLIICMVRKSELIEASWEEIDFDRGIWEIPKERMKMGRPHVVPLSMQAKAIFKELKTLSSGSNLVFPSRGDSTKPISKSTLNLVVRSLDHDIQDFVIHDFRRTASTHLNEQGYQPDWIEKALAHEMQGVRGVYNRAEYVDQRGDMLQWWASLVDTLIDETQSTAISRHGKLLVPTN